jgi:glutamate dehydrogenase
MWSHQYDLTVAVLKSGKTGAAAVKAWVTKRAELTDRVEALLGEIQSAATPDLAMLAVANRELRALATL